MGTEQLVSSQGIDPGTTWLQANERYQNQFGYVELQLSWGASENPVIKVLNGNLNIYLYILRDTWF